MMNDCRRLGIKNFKSIRHPGQIKLEFDLCVNDKSAPRYVSSKGDDDNQNIQMPIGDRFKLDDFEIKKTINDGSRACKYSKILITNILYFIARVLCIILKYTTCLLWCLFKIFLCTIIRVLTKSRVHPAKDLICHPIKSYHYHHRF